MERQRRTTIGFGILLVLLGAWFLAAQLLPDLNFWINATFSWPLFVIGAGVLLLVIGLLVGAPGMAVPAAIVGGIGGLLYWQNTTGNWESWAYVWALIPGFVGIGILIAGLLGENPRQSFREGSRLLIISLIMFAIFASFLGGWNLFGPYWPVLIILLGFWLLIQPLFRSRAS
jgi:hypothetical protein